MERERTQQLSELAVAAVQAVGGGLIGLDVIEADGECVLPEANPAFSMPAHLPRYMRRIVEAALDRHLVIDRGGVVHP